MTDAQQAQKFPSLRTQLLTAAHEFSVYLPEPLEPGDCDELMHILEPVVTSLLAAREREVWREAAKMIEEYKSTGGTTSSGQATICRLAVKFRQQAEEVKP